MRAEHIMMAILGVILFGAVVSLLIALVQPKRRPGARPVPRVWTEHEHDTP